MTKFRTALTAACTFALLTICSANLVAAFSLPGMNKAETVKIVNNAVVVPAKDIDGTAHFFVLKDGGKEIKFFAVKGSNGAIRVAFDACDACYRDKKGYEQKETKMVCRNCNMKFPIDRLGPNATGGCNPGFLSHRLEGNNVVISASDLKAGARYF
jgi:uncharacterized membrane protein